MSGTIDESIRHTVSKLSHIHFACNEEAARQTKATWEEENRIFVIGSPDIDIMFSADLPSFREACARYEIPFSDYGILIYHPVTTEYKEFSIMLKM